MASPEHTIPLTEVEIDPDTFSVEEWMGYLKEILESSAEPKTKVLLARSFIHLVTAVNPDLIDGVFGIKIVERAETRASGEDCFRFVHGYGEKDPQEITDDMTTNCTLSLEPVPGAFALYMDDNLSPKHIGIVNSEGEVVSKWGVEGHVYSHQPYFVPIEYGEHIAYYIPPATNG